MFQQRVSENFSQWKRKQISWMPVPGIDEKVGEFEISEIIWHFDNTY